jgi:hypothetical protein
MKIIKPLPGAFVATNAINLHPEYSAATTYSLGQTVNYISNTYESLNATNLNHTPDTSPTWWLKLGPNNQSAMFDNQVSTATTKTGVLNVVCAPGYIDAIFLGNLQAESATITVRNGLGGPIIYQQTQILNGEESTDWYQYFFFDPLIKRTQALFTGIPPYVNSYITLELENGILPTSIGIMTYGKLHTVGKTQYGASTGIVDYSKKETDDFGNTTFIKRAFSKRMNCQVFIDNLQLNRTQRLMYDIRAVPVVWIASEDPTLEEPLVVFGFYRDFSTEISYPTASLCNIEVEGLI